MANDRFVVFQTSQSKVVDDIREAMDLRDRYAQQGSEAGEVWEIAEVIDLSSWYGKFLRWLLKL